jgi:hypothetical protein
MVRILCRAVGVSAKGIGNNIEKSLSLTDVSVTDVDVILVVVVVACAAVVVVAISEQTNEEDVCFLIDGES